MIKSLFIKEATISTVIVLLFTYVISFIPFSQEFAKALHQGFADFDIYDLYYSGKDKKNIVVDNDIVLVGIGSSRSEIADQVKLISLYSPKLIAIDATFENQGESLEDQKFAAEMKQHSNIVYANRFDKENRLVPNVFCNGNCTSAGYIDFSSKPSYSVIRTYGPFATVNGKQYEAFTSAIVHKVDFMKYNELKKRNNPVELINYNGNLNNYLNISQAELNTLDSQQLKTLLNKRIVLLGFFVKNPPKVLEDLYYSPLNEQVAGKSFPDMYGVVVHANILSMIFKNRFAKIASKKTSYLFAFLITFLLNLYFISRFHEKTHPAHSLFLLIQLLVILLVLYLFLLSFSVFWYKPRFRKLPGLHKFFSKKEILLNNTFMYPENEGVLIKI